MMLATLFIYFRPFEEFLNGYLSGLGLLFPLRRKHGLISVFELFLYFILSYF